MVPLRLSAGGPLTIQLDLCYRANGTSNPLIGFSGADYSVVQVTTILVAQAAVGTVVPGAGTWLVGACVVTNATIGSNNFVNGYVQVTN